MIPRSARNLLMAAAVAVPMASRASHIMGGELVYKHLGGLDYEVTLVLYRDCQGIPVNAPETVSASSTCGTLSFQVDTIGVAILSSGCSSMLTTCQGGPMPGAEVYAYRDTVTLPMACSDWVFSWASCCRNAAVTNLANPDAQDYYVEARLNNLNGGNSSPVFQELQMPFTCTNATYCVSNSAYDADGDSLVYSMVVPSGMGGTPLAYNLGFSVSDPYPSVGGHSFDPVTGNHCAVPSAAGAWVMAYKVEEYRNGALVGSAVRDIQIWTSVCPSAVLDFAGTVTDTTGAPVTAGTVELYEYGLNAGGSTIVATTSVNGQGQYSFTNQPNGQYLVRAVPDSTAYPNTATSYHTSTHYWTYADVLGAICDTTIQADIQLVGFGNLAGTGYINGYLGDLGIVRSSGPGDAWDGEGIVLESWPAGELVAYTWTDASGNYAFANVPFGTYRILVDHPGLPMLAYYVITLDGATPSVSGLDYGALPEGISTYASTGIDTPEAKPLLLSPNPAAQDVVFIDGLEDGAQDLLVVDAAGRTVLSTRVSANGGRVQLDIARLQPGAYGVRVGNSIIRLVRQ
ncbi:MAG: hypothetical protein JNL05_15880 [Flavobacteriales bacterium]|nr:hypothetical protein [Flavobacteriales bacterium]